SVPSPNRDKQPTAKIRFIEVPLDHNISPSTCFRFMRSTQPRRSSFASNCGAARYSSSSRRCRLCLVGMEACATAHYWARELTKLGHQVRLMPAKDVKAYVKRNKNDAADAQAICEAVRRPTMRFVQIKSVEQQGQLMLHRARDLL